MMTAERIAEWKEFIKNTSQERLDEIYAQFGICQTIEGKTLSEKNSILIQRQEGKPGVYGGFQQWRKEGRMVRKGEKSFKIFVPKTFKDKDTGEDGLSGFIMVSMFSKEQTDEILSNNPIN